ncbi:MAG: hypothetical protein JNM36_12790 [Chitinophagales bacterium]|nr:hypothetical protein [Chitinophagales bacterium]
MKTPSTDLFDLIQSMTSQEKKYFKQYAARYSSDYQAVYMDIFDAIAAQDNYNEPDIKKQFAHKKEVVKQFAVYKNYLLNTILDALATMQRQQDTHIALLQQIQHYHILFNRRLYRAAQKIYHNIETTLQEEQLGGYWLELLKFQPQMIKILNDENRREQLTQLWQDAYKYLEQERINWQYIEFSEKTKMIGNSGEYTEENAQQLRQMQQHPLLQQEYIEQVGVVNQRFYDIHLFCDNYLDTLDNSYFLLQKLLQKQTSLFNTPQHKESDFLFACSRFLQVAYAQNYYSDMLPIIDLLQKSHFSDKRLAFLAENVIFQYSLNCLILGMTITPYNSAKAWWEAKRQWWGKQHQQLSNTSRNLHQLNLIRLFFLMKEWQLFVNHTNDLITHSIVYANNADSKVRILWLMAQYEMDNADLLDNFANSVKNWLLRHQKLLPIENTIVRFFKKIPNLPNKKTIQHHFKALHDQLLLLDPNTDQIDYFFWAWLVGKVDKKNMQDVLRNTERFPQPSNASNNNPE